MDLKRRVGNGAPFSCRPLLRLATALIASTVALTSATAAIAPAPPAWAGVWRGTFGTAPVQVCLQHRVYGDSGSDDNGSYYYLRHLVPIALVAPDRTKADLTLSALPVLNERYGEATSVWRVTSAQGNTLTATWTNGSKTLPIALTRVALVDRTENPCGDMSYIAPRLTKPVIVKTRARLGRIEYTVLTANVGKQFEEVVLSSFQIDGTTSAIQRVNAELLKTLPTKADGSDYLDCMMSNLAAQGNDGDYDDQTMPELMTRSWMVSSRGRGWYCGMAHPENSSEWTLWNLRNGQAVNLWRWLKMPADKGRTMPDADDAPKISRTLRKLLIGGWRATEVDCRDLGRDHAYWTPHVTAAGLAFTPDVPHVMQGCVADVVVPFGAVSPLLNAAGQRGMASIRAELRPR